MNAYYSYLNELINKNKSSYSKYDSLKWLNPYMAQEFQQIRDELLNKISSEPLFKGTKPYYKQISKGCNICGSGKWSCLFITGKCNGNCFYCPTEQKNDETPTTQGLTFPTPESFAEYIAHFKFKGVSFSGGEPLLFPQRVLDYLTEVRKQNPAELYVWMYTNGILANDEIFKKLSAQGLNEVRFDIGATGYKLDKIKHAKDKIENITIEIPAIPEEKEQLKKLLPEIIKSGVTNLNLHQLRLTEYNVNKLSKKDYTYIPAERPIVLESEMAALEIINYAQDNNLEIGINYCSFFFKNRFQAAGYRKTLAENLHSEKENITEKGYIRNIHDNKLSYSSYRLFDENPESKPDEILKLNHKNYQVKQLQSICHQLDNDSEKEFMLNSIIHNEDEIPDSQDLFEIWQHEKIESNLREY